MLGQKKSKIIPWAPGGSGEAVSEKLPTLFVDLLGLSLVFAAASFNACSGFTPPIADCRCVAL